jgi:hypothetical protein
MKTVDKMLPRFCRRRRQSVWQFLCLLALALVGLLIYYKYAKSAKPSDDNVIRMRQKRFQDYQESERRRSGPGENGEPVRLEGEEKKLGESLFKKEAFNIIASDKIALDRSIRDVRDEGWVHCKLFSMCTRSIVGV